MYFVVQSTWYKYITGLCTCQPRNNTNGHNVRESTFWRKEHYVYSGEIGTQEAEPVREMRVRSLITSPSEGETLSKEAIEIRGIIISGKGSITQAEVSMDGGAKWESAHLDRPESEFAPTVWSRPWTPTRTGTYTFLSRATDSAGEFQPLEQVRNKGGYGNNGVQAFDIAVA
jgi:hypothetical protein